MKTLPKERRYETPFLSTTFNRSANCQADRFHESTKAIFPGIEFEKDPTPQLHHWTLWKLPLFDARTSQDVLNEVRECRSEYSDCYIRVVGV